MVIEVDWLYGTRRQELQRFTRTLHSRTANPEYHILMTLEEYLHDRKRLFSVMDKGFKVEIHREGIAEETISKRLAMPSMPVRRMREPKESATPAIEVQPISQGQVAGILELPGVKR